MFTILYCVFQTEGRLKVTKSRYAVNVLIFRKRCKMVVVTTDTNKQWHDCLWNSGNSSDLEWPSRSFTYCKSSVAIFIFVQLCSSWQDYIDRARRAVPRW